MSVFYFELMDVNATEITFFFYANRWLFGNLQNLLVQFLFFFFAKFFNFLFKSSLILTAAVIIVTSFDIISGNDTIKNSNIQHIIAFSIAMIF